MDRECDSLKGGVTGLGRCDSCQEECQSSVRCERYQKGVYVSGEV